MQEPTVKEEAVQKLENAEIEPDKQEEAEAVKEDLDEEIAENTETNENQNNE